MGSFLPNVYKLKKKNLFFIIYSRIIFLIAFPLLKNFKKNVNIYFNYLYYHYNLKVLFWYFVNLLNFIIFAISAGYCTSLIYVVLYDNISEKFKKKFASLISLCYSSGIFFGSLFASLVINRYFV
jgi:hypothetical protein